MAAALLSMVGIAVPLQDAQADSTLNLFDSAPTITPFLSVDFGESGGDSLPETGFFAFERGTVTGLQSELVATSEGPVTVSVNGQDGFFLSTPITDSGALTFAEMYSDFVYANDGATISFDIAGLLTNRDYELTVYAWQNAGFNVETGFVPAGDTTGPSGSIAWDGSVPPTTNDEYAFTGIYNVGPSGTLSFDAEFISDTHGSLDLIRVSGFQLGLVPAPEVPEPSTFLLFGAALALLAGYTYRRRRLTRLTT